MGIQEQQIYETPPRFMLGRLTKSPEAEKLLTKEEGGAFLCRHHHGDWGIGEGYAEENERNLELGTCTACVMSKFEHSSGRIVGCCTFLQRDSTVVFTWDEVTLPFLMQFLPGLLDL
jgi:hypothetical protein